MIYVWAFLAFVVSCFLTALSVVLAAWASENALESHSIVGMVLRGTLALILWCMVLAACTAIFMWPAYVLCGPEVFAY